MTRRKPSTGPGRRAVLRWAWRLFRREWRQLALTICLVTIAVGGAVWATTAAVSGGSKQEAQLGDAKALIRVDTSQGANVPATLAAIRARFGDAEVVARTTVAAPGLARPIELRAQDPDGEFSKPTVALRSGRYPTADGEVALTAAVAEQLDARTGSQVVLGGVSRTVVGLVENPRNLDDEFALVPATTTLPGAVLSVLVGVDRPAGAAAAEGPGFDVITVGGDDGGIVTLVIAAVTVSMALVGLVAASSFLVIARRRQRQLGVLGALGASEHQVRFALVATGALVGTVASAIGAVLGLSAWLITAPVIERASAHRIDRWGVPWPLLALCVALALVATVAAAWWPARAVSRVPVVAAISMRPSPPRPVHRSALLALFVLAGGVAAIAIAKPRDAEVKPWLLITGLLAVIAGTVLVAPTVIRLLALPARRLPLPARLALRDLARYQARAAAALAAITLALGIAVATAVVAKATDDDAGAGNLASTELLVSLGPSAGPFTKTAAPAGAASLDQAASSIGAAIPGAHVYPLDVALPPATGSRPPEPVAAATPVDHGFKLDSPAYVATTDLLALFHIDPASIAPTTDMLSAGDVRSAARDVLLDSSVRPTDDLTTPAQHVDLSPYDDGPHALITEAAMQRHGWTEERVAWLIESPASITADQLTAARRSAAVAGLAVENRDVSDAMATLGRGATIGGSLLALAILALTVGLIRGESAGDVRTLTAVGAPARTRRATTATATAALALGGVALASVGAYIAVAAVYRSQLSQLGAPPVENLALLWLGLPAVAALAGWVVAGRQPSRIARPLG